MASKRPETRPSQDEDVGEATEEGAAGGNAEEDEEGAVGDGADGGSHGEAENDAFAGSALDADSAGHNGGGDDHGARDEGGGGDLGDDDGSARDGLREDVDDGAVLDFGAEGGGAEDEAGEGKDSGDHDAVEEEVGGEVLRVSASPSWKMTARPTGITASRRMRRERR